MKSKTSMRAIASGDALHGSVDELNSMSMSLIIRKEEEIVDGEVGSCCGRR